MTWKENSTLVFNGSKLHAQIADELGISQSQLKVTESATNHGGGGSRVEVAIAVVANAPPALMCCTTPVNWRGNVQILGRLPQVLTLCGKILLRKLEIARLDSTKEMAPTRTVVSTAPAASFQAQRVWLRVKA